MKGMDMGITLGDLARELGAQPSDVAAFSGFDGPMSDTEVVSDEMAKIIRELWGDNPHGE